MPFLDTRYRDSGFKIQNSKTDFRVKDPQLTISPLTNQMSKKGIIISFLLLVVSLAGYSQNDWREGYIIENSGDTIHGLVDYRSPRSNSQFSYFRKSEQDKPVKYSPEEIKGYRYDDGKYYISKTIGIDGTEKTAFLEYLFQGRANVYFLKDENERYFLEVDGQMHELKNSEKTVYARGSEYSKEQKEYIGVMNHLFQEADMQEVISRTELRHKSLIRTARKYHNTVSTDQETVTFEKKTDPLKFDFGVVYGRYNKTLHLERSLVYSLEDSSSDYFGLAFNFRNIPGVYERFSLQLEVLASEYYFDNEKKYQLNVPVLLDYKLSSNKFYPKVELGTSMYFTRTGEINAQHIALIGGVSLHYEFFKDYRVFVNTRVESSPGTIRFGGGILF